MNEPRCNFLGGPLDGRLIRVNPQLDVWLHSDEAPAYSLDTDSIQSAPRQPPERTKYIRQGSTRVFMHESEAFE